MQGIRKRIRRVMAAGAISAVAAFNTAAAQEVIHQSPLFIDVRTQAHEALRKAFLYENLSIYDQATDRIEASHFSARRAEAVKPMIKSLREDVASGRISVKAAVNEILDQLDPHSSFTLLKSGEYVMMEGAEGSRAAGFDFRLSAGEAQVTRVYYNGPADEAGLLEGDTITAIEGEALDAKDKDALDQDICHTGQKSVDLSVRRFNRGPIMDKTVSCVKHTYSVQRRILEGQIGYVYVSEFSDGVAGDMRMSLRWMEGNFGRTLKGYVLDLRGDLGGRVEEARQIIDAFVNSKAVIFQQVDRNHRIINSYATPGDDIHGKPLVVLVDGDSFSASELVAGSLQYAKRAIVMGTRTGGKGSVQTRFYLETFHLNPSPVQMRAALRLTTDLYTMPDGSTPQIKGIIPDITVVDENMPRARMRSESKQAMLLANPEGITLTKAEAARTRTCEASNDFTRSLSHLKYPTGAPDGALICAYKYLTGPETQMTAHPDRQAMPLPLNPAAYAVAVPARPKP